MAVTFGGALTGKGRKETLQSDGNAPPLDWRDGYTAIYIYTPVKTRQAK